MAFEQDFNLRKMLVDMSSVKALLLSFKKVMISMSASKGMPEYMSLQKTMPLSTVSRRKRCGLRAVDGLDNIIAIKISIRTLLGLPRRLDSSVW